MNDIDIKLGADYTGSNAFKKAQNDVFSLEKSVKNLAKQFGLVFGTQQLVQFGSEAVRAFATSEQQTQQLTQSLKNLGLSLSAVPLDDYLQKMELAVGVTRDKLQPAFLDLLSVTGSINKSQRLLNTSLEIQASGLMDVQQAADVLSKAYIGNKKGLKELRLGLTTAELDLLTFDQILALVEQRFSGQLQAKLGTTASNIERMGMAARQAKALIGEGLVNSFSILAGNGDIDAATIKLVQFGQAVSNVLQTLSALTAAALSGDFKGLANNLTNIWSGKKPSTGVNANTAMQAQQKQAEIDAAKRAKDLAALQRKAAKDQAALLKVQRAKSVFDLKKIQIEAALRGQITEEDRKRLLELKKITETEVDAVTRYNGILSDTQKKTADLIALGKSAKDIPNPYEPWAKELDKSQSFAERLKGYASFVAAIVANPFTGWFDKIFGINERLTETVNKTNILKMVTNPFAAWFEKLSASNPVIDFIYKIASEIAKIIENPFNPWQAALNLGKLAINSVLSLAKTILSAITGNPFKSWADAGSSIKTTLENIWKNILPNFKGINWNPFSGWSSAIDNILSKLKSVWEWLKKFDINPFDGKSSMASYTGASASIGNAATSVSNANSNQNISINVSGAMDPYATANAIANALNLSATSTGSYNSLGISKSMVSYA